MLIAIEGVDRSGKSTLAKGLAAALQEKGEDCVVLHSPMRNTANWDVLEALMERFESFDSEGSITKRWALHLQFLANKYEVQEVVKKALGEKKFVILDRYIISGLTYSLMDGVDLVHAHRGLILPACTIYLALTPEVARERDSFGEGFRETPEDHDEASRCFNECIRRFSSNSGEEEPLKHPIISIDASLGANSVLKDAVGVLEGFM